MEKIVKIKGMSCDHCIKAVEIELNQLKLESMNVEIGKAEIKYDPARVSFDDIKDAITEAGFEVFDTAE